jgi:hypothetical protein
MVSGSTLHYGTPRLGTRTSDGISSEAVDERFEIRDRNNSRDEQQAAPRVNNAPIDP